MNTPLNINKKPYHLPEKLTISFPIWGLYATDKEDVYYDFDRMMREHKERGFNCIRLDDGAGFMHNPEGEVMPPVELCRPYGKYSEKMRQATVSDGVKCDLLTRLIEMFEAAKKHGIYIILSSWFYLHTYWHIKDKALSEPLVYAPSHERFGLFAKFLHYIICELEKRNLDSQIAFAEIFNEVDGLEFCGGYGNMLGYSDETLSEFRKEQEDAIAWLKSEHPQLLFAFDNSRPRLDGRLVPRNADVYNFHNYFMWGIYSELEANKDCPVNNPISKADVARELQYPELFPEDWYGRVAFYSSLDQEGIEFAEKYMTEYLHKNIEKYNTKLDESLREALDGFKQFLPDTLLVCGEGVSYCGYVGFTWEEKSEDYWNLIKKMMADYRDAGLWGTVVRTCCGPEDPVWNMCADKLLEVNNIFLQK